MAIKRLKLPPGLQWNGKVYKVDKVVNGERLTKRLNVNTAEEAIREFSMLISDAIRGKRVTKAAVFLTVYDILEYYYENHLASIKSGKNAKFHIPTLDRLIGARRVLDLRKSDMEKYKATRRKEVNKKGEPISARTIQAELQFLIMSINHAVDDELLPRNPIQRFCRVKVPRKKKIVLDHGQEFGPQWIQLYKHICRHEREHWKLFFIMLYETGMRPAEVGNFRGEWLQDTGNGYLIKIPKEFEKSDNDDRRIPVSKILEKRLIPQCSGKTGMLFEHTDYNRIFKKLRTAGFPTEITAYALRRTRLTIWDNLDTGACRVAAGHVPLDPHEESYVEITNDRLMRLVGIEAKQKLKIFKKVVY